MFQLMSIFNNCCTNKIDLGQVLQVMKGLFDIVCFVIVFVCLCISTYNLVMAHLAKENRTKKQLLIETFRYIIIAVVIVATTAIVKCLMNAQYSDNELGLECWCGKENSFNLSKDIGLLSLLILLYVVPTVLFIVGAFKAVLNYGKKTIESKIKFKRGIRFYIYAILLYAIGLMLLGKF